MSNESEKPALTYTEDFVFGKNLLVQGDIHVGLTFKNTNGFLKLYQDRHSNGFYAALLPRNYMEEVDGEITTIESQVCAVHDGSQSESTDGAGQKVWMILYTVDESDIYSNNAIPNTALYLATSINYVLCEEKDYGVDILIQFRFNFIPFNSQDGKMLRIALYNSHLVGHEPSYNSLDLEDMKLRKAHGGVGTEPLRLRRAYYSETQDGLPDDLNMTINGVRFWSGIAGGTDIVLPENQHGMPLFRIFYRVPRNDDMFSLNNRLQSIEDKLRELDSPPGILKEIITWYQRQPH